MNTRTDIRPKMRLIPSDPKANLNQWLFIHGTFKAHGETVEALVTIEIAEIVETAEVAINAIIKLL